MAVCFTFTDYAELSEANLGDIERKPPDGHNCFLFGLVFNKVKGEGYVLVRNPHELVVRSAKCILNPSDIDALCFGRRIPTNILERLDMLNNYFYYFHVTITGYDKVLEPNQADPRKDYTILSGAFEKKVGSERIIWRYDPISTFTDIDVQFHQRKPSNILPPV